MLREEEEEEAFSTVFGWEAGEINFSSAGVELSRWPNRHEDAKLWHLEPPLNIVCRVKPNGNQIANIGEQTTDLGVETIGFEEDIMRVRRRKKRDSIFISELNIMTHL